jgi:hypothetical protein
MKTILLNFFHSFPIQLLLLHLRNNLAMLLIWVILSLLITNNLGSSFGMYYLFVSPEYLSSVNTYSFFLVGLAFGIFVMCWHLSVYLLYAWRFPFLATVKRPFLVFCINNSIIPLLFFIVYLYHQITFESYYEYQDMHQYLSFSAGFFGGSVMPIVLLSLYFALTNKNIQSYLNLKKNSLQARIDKTQVKIEQEQGLNKTWRVDSFINETAHIRKTLDIMTSSPNLRLQVFKQNHYNALFLQFGIILTFIIVGTMSDNGIFRLPASANIFLLFSVVVSLLGALSFWFRRWQFLVLFLALAGLNFITKLDYLNQTSMAFGLKFNVPPAPYITDSLRMLCREDIVKKDKAITQNILEKWRLKNQKKGQKPPMIITCVSGGGLKATAWAMQVLQTADSLSKGKFMSHTSLMTGASGGMLGAAYFRELALRKQFGTENIDLYGISPLNNVSKDLLNAVSFSIVTNDLFFPRSTWKMGVLQYRKDRGYAFERQLHENTFYKLDKKLSDYALPEQEAKIPMLFVTPSVLNDGRMMIISPQPVSYMMLGHTQNNKTKNDLPDAVDFGALFKQQEPGNLRFSTALRANATFPFILPNMQLPTQPVIEIVDAGFRDNVGLKSALRFIHAFDDWIKKNTSGVMIVTIRAYEPNHYAPNSSQGGLLENLFNPLSFAGNFLFLQEYEYQNELGFLRYELGMKNIELLDFIYTPSEKLLDSPTSFHLTSLERNNISAAINLPNNRLAFDRLGQVLKR